MQVGLAHPTNAEDSLHLNINISTTLGISASDAKRKLSRYFMDHVSMFIGPEDPILLLAEQSRIFWRFPISIRVGRLGKLGLLGSVDVDAYSGEILLTESYLSEIKNNADLLAKAASHHTIH